jgi:cation diffusion facilitator family transporter
MTDRLLIDDVASPQTHSLPEQLIRKVTWIGMAVNLALAVFKLAAGIYGQSQAVTADGIEALLDVFTVILVYAASRFWSRPPDDSHPFGHGRMETLVAVCIGASLVAAAVGIGWQSIATLHERHGRAPGWIAAIAALSSVVGKEILYRWTLPDQERCGGRHRLALSLGRVQLRAGGHCRNRGHPAAVLDVPRSCGRRGGCDVHSACGI